MENFIFKNPTEILFGKDMIAQISTRIPKDSMTLLLYGKGSIKRNGVYEQIQKALQGRCKLLEFSGIEPNPLFETCMDAVRCVKENKISFILAAGGGSVIDAAKFIAAAACLDESIDPWEILKTYGACIQRTIPIGSILTLPATGSESNGNSVISRKATDEKLAFYSPLVFPQFSVLDPQTTMSLPEKQVRNGIVDAYVHVLEQYLTYPVNAPIQDRFAESILQTLIEVGPQVLSKPNDYEARANLMWSATMALNQLIGCGVPQDWATHGIGHELTAFYGLDHAESLAIVLPGIMVNQFKQKEQKLIQYAKRVWNTSDPKEAIEKTEQFFNSLKMPTTFKDYKIDATEAAEKIQMRFSKRNTRLGEREDITAEICASILKMRQ